MTEKAEKGCFEEASLLNILGSAGGIEVKRSSEEIQKAKNKILKDKYGRKLPPFEYRRDPVSYTGVRNTKTGRRVRHWFRSYREDRIPEYKQFVRKKGMVPDPWDSVPLEPCYRSWKHNSRKRHQWE